MGKIGQPAIAAAYDLARAVRNGARSEQSAVTELARVHAMNPTSATIYVRNLSAMLDGKTLKRTMSAPSFAWYLDRIRQDFGPEAAAVAIASVRAHVDYYATLGRGNLRQVNLVCDSAEAANASRRQSRRSDRTSSK